jgi:hypothetical protein
MNTKENLELGDPEITAINLVYNALKALDTDAQTRVIGYVTSKLGIRRDFAAPPPEQPRQLAAVPGQVPDDAEHAAPPRGASTDTYEGISPVAQKWMTRNRLDAAQLGNVFSLGGDEIDLIAESVPGKSKRTRMHNVILLKGVAGYLASGASRITHDQIKETCLHYDAFDGPNFAKNLREFAADVSGTKDSGYTLTPRGLAASTALLKQMTQRQD